jgi:hypothetical protein
LIEQFWLVLFEFIREFFCGMNDSICCRDGAPFPDGILFRRNPLLLARTKKDDALIKMFEIKGSTICELNRNMGVQSFSRSDAKLIKRLNQLAQESW